MRDDDIQEISNELIEFLKGKPTNSKALKKLEEFIKETRHPYIPIYQFTKQSPSKIKLQAVFNVFKAVHHYVQNEKLQKKNRVKFQNTRTERKMTGLIKRHLFSLFWMIDSVSVLQERRKLYDDIKKYYKKLRDIFKLSKQAVIADVPTIVKNEGKDSDLVENIIEFEKLVLNLGKSKMKGPIQYWKESLTFKQQIDQGLKSFGKIFQKKIKF
jgi:lantibiotic modifying enzyme